MAAISRAIQSILRRWNIRTPVSTYNTAGGVARSAGANDAFLYNRHAMPMDPKIAPVMELLGKQYAAGVHTGAMMYVSLAGQVMADLSVGEMGMDTILPWLSAGKPIAAVAIAQLWEKKLLELDDPVARHVPEFAKRGKEKITIRHLLTHTAGIRWARLEKGLS